LLLELDGKTFPVQGKINKESIRPYFILLESGVVFNSTDYQLLFNIEELPNNIISGTGITGQKHLCKIYKKTEEEKRAPKDILLSFKRPGESIEFSSEDTEQLKEVIQNMKKTNSSNCLQWSFQTSLKGLRESL
jgi:hypothetical protein